MSINTHEPAYKAALDSAYGELDQISLRMTELRAHKQVIEAAVNALRPLVEAASETIVNRPVVTPAAPVAAPAVPVFEITSKSHPAPEPVAPVHRHEPQPAFAGGSLEDQINHALGLAALA